MPRPLAFLRHSSHRWRPSPGRQPVREHHGLSWYLALQSGGTDPISPQTHTSPLYRGPTRKTRKEDPVPYLAPGLTHLPLYPPSSRHHRGAQDGLMVRRRRVRWARSQQAAAVPSSALCARVRACSSAATSLAQKRKGCWAPGRGETAELRGNATARCKHWPCRSAQFPESHHSSFCPLLPTHLFPSLQQP